MVNLPCRFSRKLFQLGNPEAAWQAIVGDWNRDGIDSIGLYKDALVIRCIEL
jgi:hypothetical protein